MVFNKSIVLRLVYNCHIHMILVKTSFDFESYRYVFGLLGRHYFIRLHRPHIPGSVLMF